MCEHGFENGLRSCSVAARCRCMATLQMLHSLHLEWDKAVPEKDAAAAHVDIIQWAIDHGSP